MVALFPVRDSFRTLRSELRLSKSERCSAQTA